MSKQYKQHIKHWKENGYKIFCIGNTIFAEKDNKTYFLGIK